MRDEAREAALRTLRYGDRSRAELDARLAARGVPVAAREAALAQLERAGFVDDARVASNRARSLAERGYGDAYIRADLARRSLPTGDALAELEPERERAARVVAARGGGFRTLRHLAARGFGEDALDGLVARADADAIG